MKWLCDDVTTWDSSRLSLSLTCWNTCMEAWQTDQWMDRPSYRDAWMHLVSPVHLLWQLFARIYRLTFFLTKARPTNRRMDGGTNGRTDGRTDGLTERPSYRDARTHLKQGRIHSHKSILAGRKAKAWPTNQPTDGQMDTLSYKVALSRLKIHICMYIYICYLYHNF